MMGVSAMDTSFWSRWFNIQRGNLQRPKDTVVDLVRGTQTLKYNEHDTTHTQRGIVIDKARKEVNNDQREQCSCRRAS
jgi:hypothetical protein